MLCWLSIVSIVNYQNKVLAIDRLWENQSYRVRSKRFDPVPVANQQSAPRSHTCSRSEQSLSYYQDWDLCYTRFCDNLHVCICNFTMDLNFEQRASIEFHDKPWKCFTSTTLENVQEITRYDHQLSLTSAPLRPECCSTHLVQFIASLP